MKIEVTGAFGKVVWTPADHIGSRFDIEAAPFQAKIRAWWRGAIIVFFTAMAMPLTIRTRGSIRFMASFDNINQTLPLLEEFSEQYQPTSVPVKPNKKKKHDRS